jgi:hypothetical protein
MSAEGKKKRGIAGVANAAAKPWRINGWAPDWYARKIGATHGKPAPSSGSTTMRGIIGGLLAERLGHPMVGRFDVMIGHAQSRCTHPMLTDDGSEFAEAAE